MASSPISQQYIVTGDDDWARQIVRDPLPPAHEDWVRQRLDRYATPKYPEFITGSLYLPRSAPPADEFRSHMEDVEQKTWSPVLRTFDEDSDALVQAETDAEKCANGTACVASTHRIPGLTEPIVLQRLPPPHAPYCVLCHRILFHRHLIEDKRNRDDHRMMSKRDHPGTTPYVHTLVPQRIQTFYNLRDEHDGYASAYMHTTDPHDAFVLPIPRVDLDLLFASRTTSQKWRIDQQVLKYVPVSTAFDIHPGETIRNIQYRAGEEDTTLGTKSYNTTTTHS